MTSPIARPTFYEGEILPAADLGATVDYARNQMARQSRYLHTWGIATGLILTYSSGATLSAGIAIDGTGREIVVPADVQLDSTTFNVFPTADPTTLYPVYLSGVDQPAAASSSLSGACGTTQSTSMQETYSITFGSPGSELQIASQNPPAITDPPDGGTSAWLILIGFVTWNSTSSTFTGVATFNPATNVGLQYIGVNAAQVVSGSGSLLLATQPATPQGSNPVMAIQIQGSPVPQFVFGKLGTDGTVNPALTVTASGDVTATGQISGAVTPGSMQVQSGIAFDGMILPLPAGVALADVQSGKVTVHTHVTLHQESVTTPGAVLVPVQCRVDPSTLRVYCNMVNIAPSSVTPPVLPAWCDYLVIVAVPASGSGS